MLFGNMKNLQRFTDELHFLFVERNFELMASLEIMENSVSDRNEKVKKTASYLKEELKKGNLLAAAMRICPFIEFEEVFIKFVSIAEKTGNLRETISFLKQRNARRKNCFEKLIEAAVYPVFIVSLAIGVCGLLWNYGKNLLGPESFNAELKIRLFKSIFLLLLFCIFVFVLLKSKLGENKLYESFLAAGFLIKSGVNTAMAIGFAANIAGEDTKLGNLFLSAKTRMEYGMDLVRAFSFEAKEKRLFKQNVLNAFYYAEKSGGKNDVFERIAECFFAEDEKIRKRWLLLIEPLFISGTGMFLLVLIVNFLIPVMTELEFFVN